MKSRIILDFWFKQFPECYDYHAQIFLSFVKDQEEVLLEMGQGLGWEDGGMGSDWPLPLFQHLSNLEGAQISLQGPLNRH